MSAIPDHTGDPAGLDRLDDLRDSSAGCTRCDLYRHARGTVFGAGRESAWLMLVGEQPGDQEDLAGEPFVGPAGRVLDRALTDAGIRRDETYVTNAVKHFKFEQRGKRRIHQKPNWSELAACRPWLDAEIELVRRSLRAVVVLGGFGWQALLPVLADHGWTIPRPRPRFEHGAHVELASVRPGGSLHLFGSYHVSQQNTFTGKLTPAMLEEVLAAAARAAGL
jgi:DNA polymerase